MKNIKARISDLGFFFIGNEPMKLTVDAKRSGLSGDELGEALREQGIECEFSDPDYLVLMVTPENSERDFERLLAAFENITAREPIAPQKFELTAPRVAMSVREAILSPSRNIPVREAVGKVCAAPALSCPPAVPAVVSGEIIDESLVRLMEYYGTETIDIIDE